MMGYLFTGGQVRGIDTDGSKTSFDVLYFEPGLLQDG